MPATKGKSKARSAKSGAKKKAASAKEDNRESQRVPIQMLVDYQCEGNYLFDFCRDLGAGGVFIETENPLANGSEINLTFTIPDSKETLETKGTVIWAQPKVPGKDLKAGMGIQFASFDTNQRELLDNFLARFHVEELNSQKSVS